MDMTLTGQKKSINKNIRNVADPLYAFVLSCFFPLLKVEKLIDYAFEGISHCASEPPQAKDGLEPRFRLLVACAIDCGF